MKPPNHYTLDIDGKEFDASLQRLCALDDSLDGSVSLTAFLNDLCVTRNTKHESASVQVKATGYLPFSLTLPWSNFRRLALTKHGDLISAYFSIETPIAGTLVIDGTRLRTEVASDQFMLTSSSTPQDPATDIRRRIGEIDLANLASGAKTIQQVADAYERDRELGALLKTLRGEACQICGYSFQMRSGGHYVECHHLEHLAHAGLDCSANMIILCANHHRQFHYGLVRIVAHDAQRVEMEIDGKRYACNVGTS